ncbi:hypothetical protein [Spirillospora sp. CA-294931]|uniref:hypothetical protein n=1 Tax=Spirillospora sp. CA-294931 TaxID=3240042 RepID=UPI003D8D5654
MALTMTSLPVRRTLGAGLAIATTSIPIQIAGGADYPTVPPGLIILGVPTLLLLFSSWRWVLVLATLVTLFLGVGGSVAESFRDQLTTPGDTVTFLGSVLQVIGLLIALAALVPAFREGFRRERVTG